MSSNYFIIRIFYQGLGNNEIRVCEDEKTLRYEILKDFSCTNLDDISELVEVDSEYIEGELDQYLENLKNLDIDSLKNKYLTLMKKTMIDSHSLKNIMIIKGIEINEKTKVNS
jgi:hypothetical protein